MKNIKLFTGLLAFMLCIVSCNEEEEIWSPNDLNVSDITSYSALLGWGGSADEFEIGINDSYQKTTKRNYLAKNLEPGADVRWRVRGIKDGKYTDWTEHSFKTQALPAKPTDLKSVPSYITATLSWKGTAKKYGIKVNDTIFETSDTVYLARNLTPSTSYKWSVSAIRGTDSSEWAEASFTTMERPAAPSNLAVTYSYKSAAFSWTGGDQKYEVKVGANTYNANGNELTLKNLNPGTEYKWNVRAVAGEGIYSDWAAESPQSSFTTKAALTVQIGISNMNVMMADVSITPGNGVFAYATLLASKELYLEFVDIYTDGDEVEFMEMVGDLYETGDPIAETWELNGSTDYTYYIAVLLYGSDGIPYPDVIKYEFTSPKFQEGLPKAGVSVSVSEITASSARIIFTPDANALGFYEGIFEKSEYDAYIADGESDMYDYLGFYGYMYLEEDDYVWSGLSSATEYVAVAAPFNANGTDGFGDLTAKAFTTLPGTKSGAAVMKRKAGKKAITSQAAVKTLLQKSKKK